MTASHRIPFKPNIHVAQAVITGTSFIRMREAMTRDDSFFRLFRLSHMFGRHLPVEKIVLLTLLITAASSCESKFLEAMAGISVGNLSGGAPRAVISIPARPLSRYRTSKHYEVGDSALKQYEIF